MQNTPEGNIKYINLKDTFIGSKYYPILRDYVGDVSYKFLDSNKLILIDEGHTAILQLENFSSVYTLKILSCLERMDMNLIIFRILKFISEEIKISNVSVNIANIIGYRVYIYHFDKLFNLQQVQNNVSIDVFENPLSFPCNEYLKHLQFDPEFNPLEPKGFSLFQNPNPFGIKNFPAPFSPSCYGPQQIWK